ncbi:MAG: iron-containing alcohol dehydrogenase [Tissierellia bacterium]|nr:iron-containing alcohol dehydrogenase [Tissierellia bacterium]
MQDFIFHISTKILFGEKTDQLAKECSSYGKRLLLVYGGESVKRAGIYDEVLEALKGLEIVEFPGIEPNPRIDSVREGIALAKKEKVDLILALGGGSVIDAAKAIAAGARCEDDPWNIVLGTCSVEEALPLGTILTLAATGSEMDAISVISNMETKEKFGWSSPNVLPKFSLLNPRYTFSVSRKMTAAGVADIMSHAMENYFSLGEENYLADRFAEGLMKTCIHYGPIALEDPKDYSARANLMWAGSWAINGLLSAGKALPWSVHALEHELSAFYDLTHGVGLAILTGPFLRHVLSEQTKAKIAQFGYNVFDLPDSGNEHRDALKAIEALEDFFECELGLPMSLEEVGIGEEDLATMAKKILLQRGAPIMGFAKLDEEDILEIYKKSLKR